MVYNNGNWDFKNKHDVTGNMKIMVIICQIVILMMRENHK